MSFSWHRGPQWNSIYEWGLLDWVSVCVGQDLALYLARTRDIESDGKGRGARDRLDVTPVEVLLGPYIDFPLLCPN